MTLNHHADKQFLEKLNAETRRNLSDEKFGVPELAKVLGMSRATLHLKIKTLTKQSASAWIRKSILERARELLRQNAGNISEIAIEVGFASVTYFDKSYHDYFGYWTKRLS